jgi:hypothetical protein
VSYALSIHQKECQKGLGCSLYIRCALSIEIYGTCVAIKQDSERNEKRDGVFKFNIHGYEHRRYSCAFDYVASAI